MKAAIIGFGVIGRVHAEILVKQGIEITAVCDVNEAKLNDELIAGAKKYSNYKNMLRENRVDVVHICTPHYLHAEMTIFALEHDFNVLCEKPLCISEEQLNSVLQAEQNSKGQLGVCLQNRYNQANLFAKEYLKDKKILSAHGDVCWNRDEKYYKNGEWRGKKETAGGGVLINQALHTLDLMQWFCGLPYEVYASCKNYTHGGLDIEDTVQALFFGDGEGGNFSFFATSSAAYDLPVQITLSFDGGVMLVLPNAVYLNGKAIFSCDESNRSFYGKKEYGNGHEALISDFYSCVLSGNKFLIDGTEGAKVVRLILATYSPQERKIKIK